VTLAEIIEFLRAQEGKRVLVTWSDGVSQRVDINAVDDEGFLHSGPEGIEQRDWWTRFEDVKALAPVEG
jgi:hypothetical protein